MDDLETQIKQIYSDNTLTTREKTLRVQALYSSKFKSKKKINPSAIIIKEIVRLKPHVVKNFMAVVYVMIKLKIIK